MSDFDALNRSADDVFDPEHPWCYITGARGKTVRTNAYNDYEAGARFVAAFDVDGTQLVHLLSEAWGERSSAATTMSTLWSAVADGTVSSDEYGTELSWDLGAGQVRACPDGTYVRFVDAGGNEIDNGSAYWIVDEWMENAEEVMGAILGLAATLQT